jgi:hypothetical protein
MNQIHLDLSQKKKLKALRRTAGTIHLCQLDTGRIMWYYGCAAGRGKSFKQGVNHGRH